ncbi:MAG TPA: Gfo/Idh/MocA family oxidoreductase [Blastocatellia bacterium]|nr:Gfo/Idh/MocA family oxidoreductase [Blastocatellia bacterium]
MRKIKVGLIGAGFVGPLHVEAVRRLGYVEVIALAASSEESARKKAAQLSIDRAYGDADQLLADPEVEAVHICTPNYLHFPQVMSALQHGKHVICDKPLALTGVDARQMRDAARKAGLVNAVTFNYRFNPLVQQARAMINRGDIGDVRFVHGQYLQDWLLFDTDFSWRLEPEKSGASSAIGDIGSHWCDLAMFLTGAKINRVLASLTTTMPVRKRPHGGSREAFETGPSGHTDDYVVTSDDLGTVLVEFDGGARGVFSVGQVCAGHKNDLRIELNGSAASLVWEQERPNEMWIGRRDHANSVLLRDPSLLDEEVRRYARLPGGHNEGWADAFRNLMGNIYSAILDRTNSASKSTSASEAPGFPTFEDGYRANCIVDAIVRSSQDRSVWADVRY